MWQINRLAKDTAEVLMALNTFARIRRPSPPPACVCQSSGAALGSQAYQRCRALLGAKMSIEKDGTAVIRKARPSVSHPGGFAFFSTSTSPTDQGGGKRPERYAPDQRKKKLLGPYLGPSA